MKVVVQRVERALVEVRKEKIASINEGILLLVGFNQNDTDSIIDKVVKKIVNLRIFDDENGVMNLSLLDKNYSILSVSQFTLYADTKKGNRPSYINAMKSEQASILYEKFNSTLKKYTNNVKEGIFGEDMKVLLVNDGPVTIIIEE